MVVDKCSVLPYGTVTRLQIILLDIYFINFLMVIVGVGFFKNVFVNWY